ncbi:50S ribosomal protein L4 [Candidatus Chlorohelix sp.]|uniref:50S ribosomal protein L4 n=1 Tax=Candidatus Chlorohelix sp. TaxID=3139201 RepID=UPI00305F6F83
MQATVFNIKGAEVTTVELDDNIFGIEPNTAVMHQALVRQHANARQGTASTKTRQEVRGGGKKPYRQKGTGNARQGSRRAPQYTGGAVIFGPRPRSYEKDMPRKMRRLAVRSALSVKAIEDNLLFIDGFEGLEPRTKSMTEALVALKLNGQKVLILVAERDETVYRAAGNLANVKTLVAGYLNLDDMFKYTKVIVPLGALDVINRILGSSTAAGQE